MGPYEGLNIRAHYPKKWLDTLRVQLQVAQPYGLANLSDWGTIEAVSHRPMKKYLAATRVLLNARTERTTGPASRPHGHWSIAWEETSSLFTWPERQQRLRAAGVIWATESRTDPSPLTQAIQRSVSTLDLAWTLSRAQLPQLTEQRGGRPTEFLRFGIDTDAFPLAQPAAGRPLIFSAGNDRHRDRNTLLAAVSLVLDQVPDAIAVVQGHGPPASDSRISVVPSLTRPDYLSHLQQASVVVIATHDNLHVSGMTVGLEAMACGRPLVITRTPGMDDYFPEKYVSSATVGQPEDLAHRIVASLSSGKAHDSQYGQEVRAYVTNHHTERRMAASLGQLLTDLSN